MGEKNRNLPVPKVFVGVLTLMKMRSASLMASEMAVEKNWKSFVAKLEKKRNARFSNFSMGNN